jgi:hypothetical protein
VTTALTPSRAAHPNQSIVERLEQLKALW